MATVMQTSDTSTGLAEEYGALLARQRAFFESGATRPYEFRVAQLKKLYAALEVHEQALSDGLKKDLRKPDFEIYLAETGWTRYEINRTLKHLKKWMKPKKVRTSMVTQPGRSRIHYDPYGVMLNIPAYNYPVMLMLSPLIGMMAAGNCVVIKTSDMTPATNEAFGRMIEKTFDPEYITVVHGGIPESTALLEQRFDFIMFTGSPQVGKVIAAAAARHLTPTLLELGGKSPTIVHHDANLRVAARRIINGKLLNLGQTCIGVDYVMVHKQVKDALITELEDEITRAYGKDVSASPDLARIINERHFDRITKLIDPDYVIHGGGSDRDTRYIEPTIMTGMGLDHPVMQEEIFGPVLPIFEYAQMDEVYETIRQMPEHPLSCYVFSENTQFANETLGNIRFGGGCVNNTLYHALNDHMPFGGVGESGMGGYHGRHSFESFSHKKSVLTSPTRIDPDLRYPPYGNKLSLFKRILK